MVALAHKGTREVVAAGRCCWPRARRPPPPPLFPPRLRSREGAGLGDFCCWRPPGRRAVGASGVEGRRVGGWAGEDGGRSSRGVCEAAASERERSLFSRPATRLLISALLPPSCIINQLRGSRFGGLGRRAPPPLLRHQSHSRPPGAPSSAWLLESASLASLREPSRPSPLAPAAGEAAARRLTRLAGWLSGSLSWRRLRLAGGAEHAGGPAASTPAHSSRRPAASPRAPRTFVPAPAGAPARRESRYWPRGSWALANCWSSGGILLGWLRRLCGAVPSSPAWGILATPACQGSRRCQSE